MKCGLICARRARSSASIVRVRSRPSSASSAWVETQRATSSAARASPAEACGPYAAMAATTRSSATTGAITAVLTGQSGSGHATASGPSTMVRPVARTSSASRPGVVAMVLGGPVPGEQGHRVADRDRRARRAGRAGAWRRAPCPPG